MRSVGAQGLSAPAGDERIGRRRRRTARGAFNCEEGAGVTAKRSAQGPQLAMVAGVLLLLVVMIIPVPVALINFALVLNWGLSLLIFLMAFYVQEALDFASLPVVLLLSVFARIALAVATTRIILTGGTPPALIEAVGSLVIGSNPVVGVVVYLIICIAMFLVITKGSERIGEVSARFYLDSMQGKQMTIDVKESSGRITREEADRMRQRLYQESDFYGSMDGASKFMKGDAIAALIIVVINIVGGLAVGMLQLGMSAGEAAQRFFLLGIGDGLAAQVPAMLVSLGGALLISRASLRESISQEVTAEVLRFPGVIRSAGIAMLVLAGGGLIGIAPGLPWVPFALLGAGLLWLSRYAARALAEEAVRASQAAAAPEIPEPPTQEEFREQMQVDPVVVGLGQALVRAWHNTREPDNILTRTTLLRQNISVETGVPIPPIRIRDFIDLSPSEYCIRIRGVEVARGRIQLGRLLAMDMQGGLEPLRGTPTQDPAFGLTAYWIDPADQEEAEDLGYTVVDPSMVVVSHLQKVLRRHVADLLGRQEVKDALDWLKDRSGRGAVVDEVLQSGMGLGQIQRVLQNLLREGISIADMEQILEAIANFAAWYQSRQGESGEPGMRNIRQAHPDSISEFVRSRLLNQVIARVSSGGTIRAIAISPEMEEIIAQSVQFIQPEQLRVVMFGSTQMEAQTRFLRQFMELRSRLGIETVLLVQNPNIRLPLRRLLHRDTGQIGQGELENDVLVQAEVLALRDIPPNIALETVGVIQ